MVLAYVWFSLAYEGANENAKEYREIREKLSEKQLKEAQKAAEELRKKMENHENQNG
ncbi:MAG: hypothetical protein R2941_25855 [Desulfobacterales bacterium]